VFTAEVIVARASRLRTPNVVHHVVNRGNRKKEIFHKHEDYRAFVDLLAEACSKFRMRLLAFCVMNNHWHLVVWPDEVVSLSAFMHWLTSTHVRRYHKHYNLTGTGHLYQGRYRNRICQDDRGVLAVMRYVESNPLAAGLVKRAQDWPWSSLRIRIDGDPQELLAESPIPLPANWTGYVNETTRKERAEALEACKVKPIKRVPVRPKKQPNPHR
jgi:putative transposase